MSASLGHRAMPAQAQWTKWNTEVRPYGVGIEEEVMLVDPQRRWALAQRIDDVLHELPAAVADHVSAETHQAAIELTTDPHDRLAQRSRNYARYVSHWITRSKGSASPQRALERTPCRSGQRRRSRPRAVTN